MAFVEAEHKLNPSVPTQPPSRRLRPDETPHPLQVKAWREMGASARSQMGIDLRQQVRHWKLAALRAQHRDWPEERLRRELAQLYLRGHT